MHKTFQLDAEGQVYVVKENGRLQFKYPVEEWVQRGFTEGTGIAYAVLKYTGEKGKRV